MLCKTTLMMLGTLIVSGCQTFSNPCRGIERCLSSLHGIILGGSSSSRNAAKRELQQAASTYYSWTGKSPPSGAVALDQAARRSFESLGAISWRLTFDPTIARNLRAAIVRANDSASGAKSSSPNESEKSPLPDYEGNSTYDLDRPGVLAHEICHKYASLLFDSVWHKRRDFPDMLDEVAAISCESRQLKSERLDEFSRLVGQGEVIPWDTFLLTEHPLKSDKSINDALQRLQASGSNTVTFSLGTDSSYTRKTDLFYNQGAAFGEFLRTKSCYGGRALGELLVSYDQKKGLNAWLSSHGPRMCLPSSTATLGRAIREFIEDRKVGRRAGSA